MYFHVVAIKEKNGLQSQLDVLIQWESFQETKDFLSSLGVIVVSVSGYSDRPFQFWNIIAQFPFKEQVLNFILKDESLEKALRSLLEVGIYPKDINFLKDPIQDKDSQNLIAKISSEYQQESSLREETLQKTSVKEAKKYENTDVQQALKVVNSNIDRIDQLLLVGKEIISGSERKKLSDFSTELKKIRLGTNFDKMAQLLITAQSFIEKNEDLVLSALDDKKFLIDRNSFVTNVDVISEYSMLIRAREKYLLRRVLSFEEMLYAGGQQVTIFSKFFMKDFLKQFQTLWLLVPNMVSLLEYFSLFIIVLLSVFGFFAPRFWWEAGSLFYLPALGFLWILFYGYGFSKSSSFWIQIVCLAILVAVYFSWITLIENTFSF